MKAVTMKQKPETPDKSKSAARLTAAEIVAEIKQTANENWLPTVYQNSVRVLRTRASQLNVPPKENKTEIFYTLLGVELKAAKQRINCPDLATARFLQVFARLGCAAVAVPYDITKISVLADELESVWQRSLLILEQKAVANDFASGGKLRGVLVKELRREIEEIGAGDAVPQFNQNTKQRTGKYSDK